MPYSRSSFERVGLEVGTLYRRAQARIEEVLIHDYAVPAEAHSVSISIDRVALPMEEPIEAPPVPVDPPWVAAALAKAPPYPPRVQAILDEMEIARATHGEDKVARNFRMAYCATVTLHDADGDALHTIRCLVASSFRLSISGTLPSTSVPPRACSRSSAKRWPGSFGRWRHALKYDDGAAAQIVEELVQSGLDKVTLDGAQPVEAAIRYFRARLPRMNYAAARRAGLPIGSGNVEATRKSLVTVRMKRPGARWKHTTGDEVMQLLVAERARPRSHKRSQAAKRETA